MRRTALTNEIQPEQYGVQKRVVDAVKQTAVLLAAEKEAVGEGRGERRVRTRQTALNAINSIQIPFLSQPSRTCQVSLTVRREANGPVACL